MFCVAEKLLGRDANDVAVESGDVEEETDTQLYSRNMPALARGKPCNSQYVNASAVMHNREMHATNGNISYTINDGKSRYDSVRRLVGLMWGATVTREIDRRSPALLLEEAAVHAQATNVCNSFRLGGRVPGSGGTLHQYLLPYGTLFAQIDARAKALRVEEASRAAAEERLRQDRRTETGEASGAPESPELDISDRTVESANGKRTAGARLYGAFISSITSRKGKKYASKARGGPLPTTTGKDLLDALPRGPPCERARTRSVAARDGNCGGEGAGGALGGTSRDGQSCDDDDGFGPDWPEVASSGDPRGYVAQQQKLGKDYVHTRTPFSSSESDGFLLKAFLVSAYGEEDVDMEEREGLDPAGPLWIGVGDKRHLNHGRMTMTPVGLEYAESVVDLAGKGGLINDQRAYHVWRYLSGTPALVEALRTARPLVECDWRELGIKVALYDDLREERFTQPTGVEWAAATKEAWLREDMPLSSITEWRFEAVVISTRYLECAFNMGGILRVGAGGGGG